MLDDLVGFAGWSRANARRALTAAGKNADRRSRKPKAAPSPDVRLGHAGRADQALAAGWDALGRVPRGRHGAVAVAAEAGGKTIRFRPVVRDRLLMVSGATVDGLLRPPGGHGATGARLSRRSAAGCAPPSRSDAPGLVGNTSRFLVLSRWTLVAQCGPDPHRHRRVDRLDRERRHPQQHPRIDHRGD